MPAGLLEQQSQRHFDAFFAILVLLTQIKQRVMHTKHQGTVVHI